MALHRFGMVHRTVKTTEVLYCSAADPLDVRSVCSRLRALGRLIAEGVDFRMRLLGRNGRAPVARYQVPNVVDYDRSISLLSLMTMATFP